MKAIRVLAENGLAFVASGGDMIAATGPLDAQWACHDASKTQRMPKVTRQMSLVEM
jgi:hypothetical protein